MKHLIEKGHASFRDSLRKSSTLISETTKFNVHAHSLLGVTTCQQIRSEAKEILRILYTNDEDRGTAAGDDGIDGGGGGKGCGGGGSGSDTQRISDQKVYIGIDSRAVTNSTIMGFGHTMPIHNTFSNLVYNTMSDLADRVVEMTSGNREPITFYDSRDTGLHAASKAKNTPSDGNTTTTTTTPTTAIAANTAAAAATTTATIAATTTTTADVVDDDDGEMGNVVKNEFSSLEEEILLMNYLRSTADYQNINKQLHEIIGSHGKDALILFINNRLSKMHKKHHDDDGDGGGDDDNGEEDDDAVENDDSDKKISGIKYKIG
ncbi:hypothetical protein HELRODRAFT_176693 [Helobdella robusta]|uniref:Uncharacterized protein n=1 Tax=Helobdella robusta TaxID=6412 RepID=T1FAS5_HELRO|nr:hypothetical protein HELRODRAFT_176693 [Helobdella robusta]ESN99529.1 hypothetical protein HELRODRAFT_176693 [Helobdella robusta]